MALSYLSSCNTWFDYDNCFKYCNYLDFRIQHLLSSFIIIVFNL